MTLIRILFWLLGTAVVVVTVLVAIANRHSVVFSFAPLPYEATVPLYAVVFSSVFLGLLLGWAASMLSAFGKRRRTSADPGRSLDAAPSR